VDSGEFGEAIDHIFFDLKISEAKERENYSEIAKHHVRRF